MTRQNDVVYLTKYNHFMRVRPRNHADPNARTGSAATDRLEARVTVKRYMIPRSHPPPPALRQRERLLAARMEITHCTHTEH